MFHTQGINCAHVSLLLIYINLAYEMSSLLWYQLIYMVMWMSPSYLSHYSIMIKIFIIFCIYLFSNCLQLCHCLMYTIIFVYTIVNVTLCNCVSFFQNGGIKLYSYITIWDDSFEHMVWPQSCRNDE